MNQWTFGIQQGLWSCAALDVQYIGSHTLPLDRSFYSNTSAPGSGTVASRCPNKLFGDIQTIEGATLQFRPEFFNLLNTPAFSNLNATVGTGSFGTITSTKSDNR